MEAFYFGPSDNYLYGFYHSPLSSQTRDEGVLICSPFGQEYMRSHRSLRHLAVSLAKLGYHVLRFDYRGQGDSMGEMECVTSQQWQEDILWACQELADVAMVKRLSIVGLRLGALLAGTLQQKPAALTRLVLWDPAVSGQDYIDEISKEATLPGNDGAFSVNGFIMPAKFQNSLQTLSLLDSTKPIDYKLNQVVSHETDQFTLLKNLCRDNDNYHYTFCPSPHDWNYVDNAGGILWPIEILQAIVSLFDGN